MKIYDVAVIGGGSAGVMAAIRTVLNNDECLLFPGTPLNKKRSRAFWVSAVENMPAHLSYKKGIEEPNKISLDWLAQGPFSSKFNWQKNRGIIKISKAADGIFTLVDDKEFQYKARYVILCTGVMDVQPHINGSINPIFQYANIQLVDYCLRCDGHHVLGKKVAILGHTTGAAWVGIMLHERYDVPLMTVLTNGEEAQFDQEATDLMNRYGFKIVTEKIEGIIGDAKNKKLESFKTTNHTIYADYAFVGLGMIVYNELAKMLEANIDQRGFVITDAKGKTSVDGLYVAGDLRANVKKQIYTAWDTAVDSADEINMLIRRKKRIESSFLS
ncbi:MAG: NAD(P)/FAD-dependent oxidoreductase [Bacteriovorax sp.]|nr:NAD(P)/FAD-dependent oxidoreductase [Bacteriovorax sp.]